MDERVREIKRQYGLEEKRYPANHFRRQEEQKTGKEFLMFQIYVSCFFIIAVFALSIIHTQETDQLNQQLKSAINYQMTADDLMELKEQAIAVMKNGNDLFSDLKTQTQKSQQYEKTYEKTNEPTKTNETKSTNTMDTTIPFEAPKENTQKEQTNETNKIDKIEPTTQQPNAVKSPTQTPIEEQPKNLSSPLVN